VGAGRRRREPDHHAADRNALQPSIFAPSTLDNADYVNLKRNGFWRVTPELLEGRHQV